ncbi:glycosyltransferase family 2 protein [Candidatus Gottesmanbacteria bacterium]|nr:glycosyltransferase family 2 protein [Candidatus Gottesmanbacteria bacterium]
MYKTSISVFFPCYNDAKSIGRLVLDAQEILTTLVSDWEIIVVNDGSTDESMMVLEKLRLTVPRLRIINHVKNKGYGAALRSGFAAARKSLVFYTDGDGQYSVKELGILLPLMTGEIDFVNGIKMSRKDPTYRIFLGNWYSLVARWMFWLPIYDVDCDFRLIRRRVLKKMSLFSSSGSICIELVKKAELSGARFRQVSVHHYERKYGSSHFFRIDRLFYTLCQVIILWIQIWVKYFFKK